jgi:hypothetical protein
MGRNGRHTTRFPLRNASVRAEVPTELIADERLRLHVSGSRREAE